jgi:hypothetical protein
MARRVMGYDGDVTQVCKVARLGLARRTPEAYTRPLFGLT